MGRRGEERGAGSGTWRKYTFAGHGKFWRYIYRKGQQQHHHHHHHHIGLVSLVITINTGG